ncbi:hypothetical protein GE061_004257 [Apolygus lucorum]|uniref:RNase H type-1 domain-containing protein n=1 Tax=Apolygus lucorum TaxID=248454 RepID=A0A8S9X0J7_APOLU|nr:hypothetical protein GE061_004257 [Apolygus lucorum]
MYSRYLAFGERECLPQQPGLAQNPNEEGKGTGKYRIADDPFPFWILKQILSRAEEAKMLGNPRTVCSLDFKVLYLAFGERECLPQQPGLAQNPNEEGKGTGKYRIADDPFPFWILKQILSRAEEAKMLGNPRTVCSLDFKVLYLAFGERECLPQQPGLALGKGTGKYRIADDPFPFWILKQILSRAEEAKMLEALRYAGTRSEELVVVVTDCRSALLKLSNFCMQANVNHIFIEILEEVYRMKVRGQKVRFVWTRAHVGVTGNEFADSLSNSARRNGLNLDVRLPFTDLYVVAYRQLEAGWQQLYDDARVGNHYRQMNPRIAVKPWFSRFELSRPDIRVINRLRSNHGLCGAYLHRIGLRSSSGCEDCGEEEETLKHIFMDCPIHWLARHQMLNSVGLHLENPLHFDQIIHCNLLSVYKEVCNFIKTITKKI